MHASSSLCCVMAETQRVKGGGGKQQGDSFRSSSRSVPGSSSRFPFLFSSRGSFSLRSCAASFFDRRRSSWVREGIPRHSRSRLGFAGTEARVMVHSRPIRMGSSTAAAAVAVISEPVPHGEHELISRFPPLSLTKMDLAAAGRVS